MTTQLTAAISLLALTGLAACASRPPVPATAAQAPYVPVAAEYRTTLSPAHPDHDQARPASVTWRLFREDARVEVDTPAAGTSEVWQRDGNSLFLFRLFHADRRGVEYRSDDLRVLGADESWARHSLLVEPAEMAAMNERAARWVHGHPVREYEAVNHGVRTRITWRVDLALPSRIERKGPAGSEVTELASAHGLSDAPWARHDTRDYDVIDYADLGDREDDPFVRRVEALLPGGAAHHH